jgi:hypothetical protein
MRIVAAALLAALAAAPAFAREPLHVFVHFPRGGPEHLDRAIVFGAVLRAHGFDVVDLRPVDIEMRQPTVRYFEAGLRDDAARFGAQVENLLREQGFAAEPKVRVQDFTFYSPKPRPNALELWLTR